MKRSILTALVFLAGMPTLAMATCTPPTRVTGATLNNLITGNTVCATRGSEKWQEQHRAGGELWDYKMGPGHPIDPTKKVGTWSISRNVVTYCYTGICYGYHVHDTGGGTYSFCSTAGTEVVSGAKFKTGLTSCP